VRRKWLQDLEDDDQEAEEPQRQSVALDPCDALGITARPNIRLPVGIVRVFH